MYNMEEKGFLLGISNRAKVIVRRGRRNDGWLSGLGLVTNTIQSEPESKSSAPKAPIGPIPTGLVALSWVGGPRLWRSGRRMREDGEDE